MVDYICMNASEEWLRYIENDVIKQQYGIKKYDSGESENLDDESKNDEEKPKECNDV